MTIGRPTVMTETCVGKLEEAFLHGCNDTEACLYADISRSSLYDYIERNPDFTDRKETLKQSPLMRARVILSQALDDKDLATANRVIDRKEGSKVTVEGLTVNIIGKDADV
jgi:hypothetical protein